MRKRRLYVILIAGVVLVGVFAFLGFREREPEYGGKRLSEWVAGYSYGIDAGRYTPRAREQALRDMGTNALPYLLKWIRYETPPWKSKLYGTVNPTLSRLRPSWHLTDGNEQRRADGSVFALITFCPEAEVVIAELSNLLNDPATSAAVRARAVNVLACIDHRSWKDPSIN